MKWREDEGEPLDAAGPERALAVAYGPARWPEEPVCGVSGVMGTESSGCWCLCAW